MKKVDAEEDVQDLGAPVVKGDEKKACKDAAKSVKKDGSIKQKLRVTKTPKTSCWWIHQ